MKKVNKKIIPAFTHMALRLAAIFSGHRALFFLNIEISRFIDWFAREVDKIIN